MEKLVEVLDSLENLSRNRGMFGGMADALFENLKELLDREDVLGLEKIKYEFEALVFVSSVARDAVKDPVYKEVFEETVRVLQKYIS